MKQKQKQIIKGTFQWGVLFTSLGLIFYGIGAKDVERFYAGCIGIIGLFTPARELWEQLGKVRVFIQNEEGKEKEITREFEVTTSELKTKRPRRKKKEDA